MDKQGPIGIIKGSQNPINKSGAFDSIGFRSGMSNVSNIAIPNASNLNPIDKSPITADFNNYN